MSEAAASRIDLSVVINGIPIDYLLTATISTTNCFSSDTFSVTFAVDPRRDDMAYWSSVSTMFAEIYSLGSYGASQQILISGFADSVSIDPIRRTIAVEGRDLSSSLVDCYRQQDFINQTASEVVQTIAQNHNLAPVVTPTNGVVGRYFGDGYTRLSLGQFSRLRSDWDLVVELARENGFDAFVQGSMLFFQPVNVAHQRSIFLASGDVKRMQINRSLMINSGLAARVQSWDSRQVVAHDSNYGDESLVPAAAALNVIGNQPFLFAKSNFTASQVKNSAERLTTELSRTRDHSKI